MTGTRKQGYVRLEGASDDLLQIRWETCKHRPDDLGAKARGYMDRLQSGAKRRGSAVHSPKVTCSGGAVEFKWGGGVKGVGRVFYDGASRRVFIIERSGKSSGSLVSESARTFDTFAATPAWSVLGFEVRPPDDCELEKFKFLSGRVTLQFRAKCLQMTAERWGLADSILRKHDLRDWAKAICGVAEVVDDGVGIRLRGAPRLKGMLGYETEALVRHEPERNRLLVVCATHKKRPPRWEWLP